MQPKEPPPSEPRVKKGPPFITAEPPFPWWLCCLIGVPLVCMIADEAGGLWDSGVGLLAPVIFALIAIFIATKRK